MDGRGQTFTLEAVVAGILLLASVAFALHAVTVSANTASSGDLEVTAQHVGLAQGVLDDGTADGTLRATVLHWDPAAEEFHGADDEDGYYVSRHPPTAFGASLGAMFDDRRVRYNVDLVFEDGSGERGRQRLVESGTPSDEAVRVVETVTLYDHTELVDENETGTGETLADVEADANRTFYAPDAAPNSSVHNVVRVEVELWQS